MQRDEQVVACLDRSREWRHHRAELYLRRRDMTAHQREEIIDVRVVDRVCRVAMALVEGIAYDLQPGVASQRPQARDVL